MKDRLRAHWGLVVVVSLYVIVAVTYGATVPIFETPDANGHYAYIHELTEGRGLPVHGTPSGARVTGYVAGHAPLYYLLCASVTAWVPADVDFDDWARFNPYHAMGDADAIANKNRLVHTAEEAFPWRGTPLTMHISRLVSTLLGTLAVIAAYAMVWELFPRRLCLALSAAALTAFNPMFIFTTARVSNDAAVVAFGALAVWWGVRLAVHGLSRRQLVLAGVLLGCAALSKLSGIALAPALLLALILDGLRDARHAVRDLFSRKRLRRLITRALILFGSTLLICGWWYVRNLVLYGELMGTEAWLSRTATVWPEPIGLFEVVRFLPDLQVSYWAMFGWFNIAAAPWMYWVWAIILAAGFLGLVLILVEQRTARRYARPVRAGLIVLLFAFLLIFGSVWRFIMIVPGAQGRYLMPVTAVIAVLLVLGIDRILSRRWAPAMAIALGAGNLSLAVICLFVFILPTYALPEVIDESQLPQALTRFNLTYEGTSIELLGGEFETREGHPGEPLAVSLYWRALEPPREDPVLFVQILGQKAEPIAGVDCFPGRGNFPPSLWEPGVIYRDRYVLPLAPDAQAPVIAALHVGLHWQDGPRLTATLPSGERAPDPLWFDLVPVRSAETPSKDTVYPVGAKLGEAITLVGYDLASEEVQPGEMVTVTLVWQADSVPEADYTVFVHLFDDGDLVAQDDHPPLYGEYRTSFWEPGDVVRDTYVLTLGPDQAPCNCGLQVGMYDPAAGVRLPAYDGLGGRFENDAVVAGGVIVR